MSNYATFVCASDINSSKCDWQALIVDGRVFLWWQSVWLRGLAASAHRRIPRRLHLSLPAGKLRRSCIAGPHASLASTATHPCQPSNPAPALQQAGWPAYPSKPSSCQDQRQEKVQQRRSSGEQQNWGPGQGGPGKKRCQQTAASCCTAAGETTQLLTNVCAISYSLLAHESSAIACVWA